MTYKEYIARIVYSEEDGCFIGDIVGIRDIVCFHGDSLEEIRTAFEESVDDYLLTCQEFNRLPKKPVFPKERQQTDEEIEISFLHNGHENK